jgi:hypothetical protein
MNHNNFILSPITTIMEDVISSSLGIGNGIETYPLYDYVMQSVFLKMTGAQEQKMKCILWELATNDYEYRYFRFTQQTLGECSNYNDKKEVYKDLIQQIEKRQGKIELSSFLQKNDILQKTLETIDNTFLNTNLLIWAQKSFNNYKEIFNNISIDYFSPDSNNLFTNKNNLSGNNQGIKEIYEEHLYKHRNRVAHNTLSYQQNLPTLKTLINEDYKYNNYFIYFALLILIDKIFIDLYKEYLISLEEYS